MTVVEGWFAEKELYEDDFTEESSKLDPILKTLLSEQISLNRTAYLVFNDSEGRPLPEPSIIGNKTEGALINMIRAWGLDYEQVKKDIFDEMKDQVFSFSSDKKRSTAVLHRADGTVTVFCKGASEWLLKDCAYYRSARLGLGLVSG
jgi:Ca2+ transporting ATPase